VNVSFPLRFFSSQLKFLAKQSMLVNLAEELMDNVFSLECKIVICKFINEGTNTIPFSMKFPNVDFLC
jgi:hypothetical protein